MALKFRICALLHIRNGDLIKPVNCEGVRKVGDPQIFADRYEMQGIDEIIYLDTVASLYGRSSLGDILARASARLMTPLTAAGGVRTIEDALFLLRSGADKIGLNTAAIANPAIIDALAKKIGSQSVVIMIDAKAKGGTWEAFSKGARQPSGRNAITWAKEAVDRGAGEVLVTSIDQEGMRRGFDYNLIKEIAGTVAVPVVAAGGFGDAHDAHTAASCGADAVAIASALHFGAFSVAEIKETLNAVGVAVRR